jgi:hypothetical protein
MLHGSVMPSRRSSVGRRSSGRFAAVVCEAQPARAARIGALRRPSSSLCGFIEAYRRLKVARAMARSDIRPG